MPDTNDIKAMRLDARSALAATIAELWDEKSGLAVGSPQRIAIEERIEDLHEMDAALTATAIVTLLDSPELKAALAELEAASRTLTSEARAMRKATAAYEQAARVLGAANDLVSRFQALRARA